MKDDADEKELRQQVAESSRKMQELRAQIQVISILAATQMSMFKTLSFFLTFLSGSTETSRPPEEDGWAWRWLLFQISVPSFLIIFMYTQTLTRHPVLSWTRSKAILPSWREGRAWMTLMWTSGLIRTKGSKLLPSSFMRPPCEVALQHQ